MRVQQSKRIFLVTRDGWRFCSHRVWVSKTEKSIWHTTYEWPQRRSWIFIHKDPNRPIIVLLETVPMITFTAPDVADFSLSAWQKMRSLRAEWQCSCAHMTDLVHESSDLKTATDKPLRSHTENLQSCHWSGFFYWLGIPDQTHKLLYTRPLCLESLNQSHIKETAMSGKEPFGQTCQTPLTRPHHADCWDYFFVTKGSFLAVCRSLIQNMHFWI